jgi:hypothetical protein
MARQFNWVQGDTCAFRAEMPGDITLSAFPDRLTHFGTKVARGTFWRAQASHWNEATRTVSRFGRDEYMVKHKTRHDAMRAAERIYIDQMGE